jgi:hypothetical protein
MVHKIAAILILSGFASALALPAAAQQSPSSQTAPSAATTASFSTFLTDVLAGRLPPDVSESMKSQSSQMLAQIKTAFAALGRFRHLEFAREDSMQGYSRYHYTALFEKGSQKLIFVTDSHGTIVGFGPDQPPAGQSQGQPPGQGQGPP